MILTNPWVGYFDRTYKQIKQSVLTRLYSSNPELTDFSESNPLIILLSIFAGIAEVFGCYIDNFARESFILVCRKFVSIFNITRLIDYRIPAANPTSGIVTLSLLDGSNNPAPLSSDFTILAGCQFTSLNNLNFISPENALGKMGDTSINVPVIQVVLITNTLLGITDGSSNQVMNIGSTYVQDSMDLTVDGISYQRVDSFATSLPTDKSYIVEVDSTGTNAVIMFGDGINGIIPPTGKNVVGNWQTTSSVDVGINQISILVTSLIIPGISTINPSNQLPTAGASNYASIDEVRNLAPRSLRTLYRAVTYSDYRDILLLCPGVGGGDISYCCGKDITLYVAPKSKGIAQQYLLQSVQDFFDFDRKMVTTKVIPKAAGISEILLKLNVTPVFRANPIQTSNDVISALLSFYDFKNQNLNNEVKLSDIITTCKELTRVFDVDCKFLSIKPYADPINHVAQLIWDSNTLSGSSEQSWKIQFLNGYFRLFQDSRHIANINFGDNYTDPTGVIQFTIPHNIYNNGVMWEFKTYPINFTIALDDFTIPCLSPSNLTVNILPNSTTVKCKDNC